MAISNWTPPAPPDPDTLRNPPPFAPFPLQQVRAGKVRKSLYNGRIETAIFKTPLSGPVQIAKGGIITDEHAYEPHRAPDKAVLHYCSAHYDEWKKELPNSESFFKPGAFGENIWSDEINEKTVCIGDRIAIGDVVLEVSENRAPCFKLNHRFEVKDMAKRVQSLFRAGWLYRVITPGTVSAGAMVRLLERPYPEWTVARVMYYTFLDTKDFEKMKEIAELPPLGDEPRAKFRARLAKGITEDQNERMFGDGTVFMDDWNEFRVVEKRKESSKVAAFVLESVEAVEKPSPVAPGSHVRVKLGGKLVRAYSVVGGTTARFELGVALDPESRGGSKYLHEKVDQGDVLTVGRITASFPLAEDADEHIMVAGGIGITAFVPSLEQLTQTKQAFHLHYAVSNEVPFEARIAAYKPNVTIYRKSLGQRMDLSDVLSHATSRSHIYTCGPQHLMDGVTAAANQHNIPESNIHMEQFTVETSGDPFTAELKQSGKVVEVGAMQTLLEALKDIGMDVDSSCEVGNCGTCKVDVCGGKVLHKGTGLFEEEKESSMLSCVSRGVGKIVLDM
jgi:MOSC domain-containing protein YiiM/ferredoxin-NADP reductase